MRRDSMFGRTDRIKAVAALSVVALLFISHHAVKCAAAAADLITVEQAHKALTGKSPPLLIDVRTKAEFESGHLKNARNVPLEEFTSGGYEKKMGEVARDAPIIVYCRSGRRSGIAQGALVKDGFTDIKNVDGGILAWAEAELPIVKGSQKQPEPDPDK
jgi:rhodanese-related sulfurtransferase